MHRHSASLHRLPLAHVRSYKLLRQWIVNVNRSRRYLIVVVDDKIGIAFFRLALVALAVVVVVGVVRRR